MSIRLSTARTPQVSQHPAHPEPPVGHMYLLISFPEFSPHSQHKALVNSGAAGSFIDRGFALKLGIPLVQMEQPFPVHALDSRPLGSGLIREATIPLDMMTQGFMRSRLVSSSLILLRFQWCWKFPGWLITIITFRGNRRLLRGGQVGAWEFPSLRRRWRVQTKSPPCASPRICRFGNRLL